MKEGERPARQEASVKGWRKAQGLTQLICTAAWGDSSNKRRNGLSTCLLRHRNRIEDRHRGWVIDILDRYRQELGRLLIVSRIG